MSKYQIDTSEWAEINGDRQNIRIRTQNTKNPVMLFVHGGPGLCDRHAVLKSQSSLSDTFTMVMWDQRSSGKSFHKEKEGQIYTVETYIEDTVKMIEYLCEKFQQEKIIVTGHSWGSVLAVEAAVKCPERIAAYIGVGQFVDGLKNEEVSYQFCVEEAKRRGDQKAVEALAKIPPADGVYPGSGLMTERAYVARYGGGNWKQRDNGLKSVLLPLMKTREYKLGEIPAYLQGSMKLTDMLWGKLVQGDFVKGIKCLEVPVLITAGRHDYQVPAVIAREWFENLSAPRKKWVWFEESAHTPQHEEAEKWAETVKDFLNSLTEGLWGGLP